MSQINALDIIRQFYVFNPDYGSRDGEEHKKLLFYHPKADVLDTKIQNVGFCEAVVKFSDNFTDGEAPFHEVNTEKELHVYCRLEDKFLMGAAFDKSTALERKYCLRGKTLHNVLLRGYETFRLFFGTFKNVIDAENSSSTNGVENLKERLDYFFTRYLTSLKLSSMPLLDALEWISYMKLDPTNYLRAQTLIDRTVEIFPYIHHWLFLYNDRLLLHNLSKVNLPSVYRYLVQNLLPMSLRTELQPNIVYGGGKRDSTSSAFFSHGKFLTGPAAASSDSDVFGASFSFENNGIPKKLPSVFLLRSDDSQDNDDINEIRCKMAASDASVLSEYFLVVYRSLSATLVFLIPAEKEEDASTLDNDFFRNLDASVGTPLTNLASNFIDLFARERDESAAHHYIYYNAVNLALTTTINEPTENRMSTNALTSSVPSELAGVLCDFREKIQEKNYFGDVVAKSDGDFWVAAKKAGARELYVIMYQKNATLTDVHDEVKRFCASIFDNVFLQE